MATVRAALMGLIAILARVLHRPAAALRGLLLAAVAMVAYNPLVVLDIGFVLSVLATFGLVTLGGAAESRLQFLPTWKHFNIRSVAATTACAQLFVLPALLYYTGVLSLVALPTNMLVLPFVPLMMLFGFLAGLLALVHPALALLPALLSDLSLGALIWLVEWAAQLPFAATGVASFPAWMMALVYAPLIVAALRIYSRTPTNLNS